MSKIGIVISSGSKILRRVVVPDVDDSELARHPMHAGEKMLTVDKASITGIDSINSYIAAQTGTMPPSSRCAVVVKPNAVSGTVVNVIHADPAIDSVAGSVLMLSPTAVVGWTWSPVTGLVPPVAVP